VRSADTDAAVRDAREMLAEIQADLPAGIRVLERTPVASSAARGLTELAEAERADVIVIGSAAGAAEGRIGLARTAGRLLQGAPCAVAVAPPGLRETGPFRHVGVALDGSPDACDGVIDLLVAGSRGYGPLQRALLGSVSEELIARAAHPVLIIARRPAPAGSTAEPTEAVTAG
jgi:nucleotide-binding universal stress UspA family protein